MKKKQGFWASDREIPIGAYEVDFGIGQIRGTSLIYREIILDDKVICTVLFAIGCPRRYLQFNTIQEKELAYIV